MIAFLNRRTAASSSSWEIGPWRTNWSRISDGTGASGVSGARLFRLRRIGTPHAMPHTRNSGHPPAVHLCPLPFDLTFALCPLTSPLTLAFDLTFDLCPLT